MKYIFLCLFGLFLINGCSVWKGVGSNLGDGLMESFENRDSLLSSMGGNITKGARDSIINDKTKQNINNLVDSIIVNLSTAANYNFSVLIDSVLGEVLQARLRQIGGTLNTQVADIRNELLGENTDSKIAALREELIGVNAKNNIADLRDELIGLKTKNMLDSLIYSASNALILKYNEIQPRLSKDIRSETGFIQQNASTLLWSAGGVIALLIAIVGYIIIKGNKIKKISELLTLQINRIPDQKDYDEVTKKIKAKAQEESLEPELRKILDKQGILNDANWKIGIT